MPGKEANQAARAVRLQLSIALRISLTIMTAIMPASHDELSINPQAELVDSDQDAEGEEDTDLYQLDQELQSAVQKAEAGDAAEDEPTAESEVGDDNRSEDESAVVNDDAVSRDSEDDDEIVDSRRPSRVRATGSLSKSDNEESDPDVAFENGLEAHSDSDSVSNESDAEAEDWDVESNEKDDADKLIRGNCM